MGTKKRNREKFLAEHQYCCFCGGEEKSQEEDHFPSRVLFDNRQWPEGYVFPACVSCNRKTRKEEAVVAFISRVFSKVDSQQYSNDFEKYAKSLEYNYPGILQRLSPTAYERRKAAEKYNIDLPKGVAKGEFPVIKIDDPVIDESIKIFGRKLLLALYYMHSSIILPQSGGVALRWYTNLQVARGDVPDEVKVLLKNVPRLERCNTNVGDQFRYSYGITECKGGAAFLIDFRMSFSIAGFVYLDSSRFKGLGEEEIYGPFSA